MGENKELFFQIFYELPNFWMHFSRQNERKWICLFKNWAQMLFTFKATAALFYRLLHIYIIYTHDQHRRLSELHIPDHLIWHLKSYRNKQQLFITSCSLGQRERTRFPYSTADESWGRNGELTLPLKSPPISTVKAFEARFAQSTEFGKQ